MTFPEGMGAGVSPLRLAAADMAARRTEAEVDTATAFLTLIGLGFREIGGYVVARSRRAGEPAEHVHAPTVGRPARTDCVMGYAGPLRRAGPPPPERGARRAMRRSRLAAPERDRTGRQVGMPASCAGPGTDGLGPSSRGTTS